MTNVVVVVSHGFATRDVAREAAKVGLLYSEAEMMPMLGMIVGDIEEDKVDDLRAVPGVMRVDPNRTKPRTDQDDYEEYLENRRKGLIPSRTAEQEAEMDRRRKANAKLAALITDEQVRSILRKADKARAGCKPEDLNDD